MTPLNLSRSQFGTLAGVSVSAIAAMLQTRIDETQELNYPAIIKAIQETGYLSE